MNTEIEAKFLDVNIEAIRKTLQQQGALLEEPMRLMQRALIEEPHHKKVRGFIRIRDEGNKVTLTYKEHQKNKIGGAKEVEVVVSSFEDTVKLFQEAGWSYTTFQESKRETWTLQNTEVVIDEWPWIKPYIEIEGNSEADIKEVAVLLGFEWKDAVFGSVDLIYQRDFPGMQVRGVIDIKEVRFNTQPPIEFGVRV